MNKTITSSEIPVAFMGIFEKLLERKSLLTPQEVAAILRKNERTVRNWLNSGQLPGSQIHGRWAIDPGVLAVWLKGNGHV